jgi:hypothetical protein
MRKVVWINFFSAVYDIVTCVSDDRWSLDW